MQSNPQLAAISTDALVNELVFRRSVFIERMSAAIDLFPTTFEVKAPAPSVAPKQVAAPAKRAAVAAPKPKSAEPQKPVRWWILEAMKRLNRPETVPNVIKEMLAMGWVTASDQPYPIVYTGMLKLQEINCAVKDNDSRWSVGEGDASEVGIRKPRGRAPRAVVAAPESEPGASIDDPSAVLAAMDGTQEAEPVAAAPPPADAPPQLKDGESLTQSANGSTVIRRQATV